MSEIVIHLGLHRTGTTFLQEEVFKKLKNVNYAFNDSLHVLRTYKSGINLISNEGLSLSMPHSMKGRIQVLNYLLALFPKAKIILGFREREGWLRSCYYRYVLSGGILRYKDYTRTYGNNIIDMDGYAKEVNNKFDEVYAYNFEDLKKKPDEVIKGICAFIGCNVPDYRNVKRNVSLDTKQLETLRKLNVLPGSKCIREVIKWLQKSPT